MVNPQFEKRDLKSDIKDPPYIIAAQEEAQRKKDEAFAEKAEKAARRVEKDITSKASNKRK